MKWHIYVFTKDETLTGGTDEAKRYLIEATRAAIEQNSLKVENCDTVENAILLKLKVNNSVSESDANLGFVQLFAVDSIKIN